MVTKYLDEDRQLSEPAGGGGGGTLRCIVPMVSGVIATDYTQGVWEGGEIALAASDYPDGCVFVFSVFIAPSKATITARARLWNVLHDELVTGCELTATAAVGFAHRSSDPLTVGTGAGELQTNIHYYRIKLDVSADGADVTDVATLAQAYLLVTHA